jgi:hypothetical protein
MVLSRGTDDNVGGDAAWMELLLDWPTLSLGSRGWVEFDVMLCYVVSSSPFQYYYNQFLPNVPPEASDVVCLDGLGRSKFRGVLRR